MHSLPLIHRIAGKPVIVVGDGQAAEAKRRLVERAGGRCVGADDADARLALLAMDAPADLAARLRARGVMVNVADLPELCDFTLPSILERGPVLIAVATGGASAGLAKALRLRLEAMLPQSLGGLAEALAAARAQLRARWPDPDARRHTLDDALGVGGALDPLREHDADAVSRWLDGVGEPVVTSNAFTLTSDDPDELTLRQARLLGQADVVRHDARVSPAVLARARADAERRKLDDPREDSGAVVVLRRA